MVDKLAHEMVDVLVDLSDEWLVVLKVLLMVAAKVFLSVDLLGV
jgi:hypothetical protein